MDTLPNIWDELVHKPCALAQCMLTNKTANRKKEYNFLPGFTKVITGIDNIRIKFLSIVIVLVMVNGISQKLRTRVNPYSQ